MMETDWKQEIKRIVQNGCSDSDIEDFVDEHPDINGKDVWDYVYELGSPEHCHGCKYIQYEGQYPCDRCSRKVITKDFYEAREKQ